MSYKINQNNFSYKIRTEDNFLSQNDFNELINLNILKQNQSEFNIFHNEVDDNGVILSTIDKKFVEKLYKNYHLKTLSILQELNYEKSQLYDYTDFTIIVTRKNAKFPIHDDTPNKLLSGVIYLYPEKNSGTIFYSDKKGSNEKKIEWVQNRAVFFSRVERETWHSYQGDGKNSRITLVYNLMTKRIKEVYKIEKKNYFFGNLRWKLNPYLFRFFKTYI